MFRPDRSSWLRVLRAAAGLLLLALLSSSRAEAPDAQGEALARSIVERADRIRFPQEGFEVDIDVATHSDNNPADPRRYRVLSSKGNENTVVMVVEPASERGQVMLMRGRDLWIFVPTASQPVRLSLSQRLTGQVANGDLARANFSGDYHPRIVRTDTIDGQPYYVLELNAVDRSVTYHRVLYWVHQSTARPLKAEFYSLSDRLQKTARYEDYRQLAGALRPARLVLTDATRENERSVLQYSSMKVRDLPDRMFTKDYLKRL